MFNNMKQIGQNHLELFAKLSKILAETFEDIHQICLSQMNKDPKQNKDNIGIMTKKNITKQDWLDKRQQSKVRDSGVDQNQSKFDNDDDSLKPPKPKKSKVKPADHDGESNGNKERKTEKKKKVAKWEQEGKPRPPLNAFMLFLRDSKFEIMEAKPQLTPSQVSSYASGLWNELGEDEKQKYRSQYRQNRAKYDEQLKQFNEKEKANGKSATKQVKSPADPAFKNSKDILDQQVLNMAVSDDSDSMSGI